MFHEESVRDYLSAYPNNWPRGLQDLYVKSQSKIPIRFIIVDDSGSVRIIYSMYVCMYVCVCLHIFIRLFIHSFY